MVILRLSSFKEHFLIFNYYMDNIDWELEAKLKEICKEVYNEVGFWYNEVCNQRCMEILLQENKVEYTTEVVLPYKFKNKVFGYGRLDIKLDNIIIELKCIAKLTVVEENQLKNYLKHCDDAYYGYLIGFNKNKLEMVRISKSGDITKISV